MQSSGISSPATSSNPVSDGPTPDRFALTGRSTPIDARRDAARRDLADVRLASRVFAPHYAAAVYRTLSRSAPLRDGTGAEAPILSEVLCGEGFELLELVGDQAWGIAQVDRSVGYIPADALQDPIAATHIVIQPNAHVNAADGSVIHTLPMGARVAAEINGAQAMLQDGGVMESKALTSLTGKRSGDYVAVAESLVGISGKTGGRSGEGVNCTGLVFLALEIAGISAPRFCDVQAAELGIPLEEGTALQRGDLIFFANHVVMLTDSDHVIHAVADSLPVTIESIDAVIGSGRFGPVVAQRRIGA